jgi:hypothetical protein
VLDRHRVTNRLITIPGGQHGGFTRDQMIASYEAIREFLAARGLRAVRIREAVRTGTPGERRAESLLVSLARLRSVAD